VADQRGELVVQSGCQFGQILALPGEDHGHIEIGEGGGELGRIGQVALRQAQDGLEPAYVRGDQGAFDEPGARRWVCQRGDHQQLLGVGNDDPFVGIGVVGRAPQYGAALCHPDDACEGVDFAG